MKPALVRPLLLVLLIFPAGVLQAQSPTPFGTPSLLPARDHYADWQASPGVAPSRLATPTLSGPANAQYAPPVTYDGAGRPLQYATARMQTPAQPALPPDEPQPAPAGAPNEQSELGCANFGDCDNGACWGESVCCEPYCGPTWYAGVGGLVFTRNRPRFSQISYDDTNLVGQVLSTNAGLGQWDFGPQATIGWNINPCWALEFTYWGIYAEDTGATAYASQLVGNLNSALDFSPLNIGADNVNDLYDAAQAHRIARDYSVSNFELNLIGGQFPRMDGSCFRTSYLAGLRYLRFGEQFQYASADANPVFGADPTNEAFYDIDAQNNLWGLQLGGRADWFVTPRFSIYAAPKFGIYANYMEQHSRIYNVNGAAVVGPGNPLAGGVYDIASDKTITSFIGELDLGLSYQFTECWSAAIGYRALAVSGVAYATDQIPSHFADLPGVVAIDDNADMILHGGYAAITLTW